MIHHVQLACPPGSEDTLRDFYGGVLGLQELVKPPVVAARGGCWFRGHGIELHLGVEQDFRPARKAHPGMLAMNVGSDPGLREGGWSFAITNDWADADAYRVYDADEEHNRLRREIFAKICQDIARVQIDVPG